MPSDYDYDYSELTAPERRRRMSRTRSAGRVCSVAVKDANTIVSGSMNHTVTWDLSTQKEIHVLKDHTGEVMSVAVQGEMIVSGGGKTVRVCYSTTGKELYVLLGQARSSRASEILQGRRDHPDHLLRSLGPRLGVLHGLLERPRPDRRELGYRHYRHLLGERPELHP